MASKTLKNAGKPQRTLDGGREADEHHAGTVGGGPAPQTFEDGDALKAQELESGKIHHQPAGPPAAQLGPHAGVQFGCGRQIEVALDRTQQDT